MLFLFQSCTDWKKPRQIEKIENLQHDLDQLEQYNSDFNKLSELIKVIEEVELRLIQNSSGDTLALEFAKILDEYGTIRPGLILLQEKQPLIDSLFIIRENGIATLRNDINNGLGMRSNYDDNISFEEESMSNFSIFIMKCDSLMKNSIEKYEILNERVEKYSLELEVKPGTIIEG